MRVIVVGLGVQGNKRLAVAGNEAVGVVDPFKPDVPYRHVEDVPLDAYDAALLCIPDEPKMSVIAHLLRNGKHVLVEKPLFAEDSAALHELQRMATEAKVTCYTAYNHRFEPHFVRMKNVIDSGVLGRIYNVRMFYGNGTARLVRDSAWRDQGAGVLPDLGSHLLDTLNFWFGRQFSGFRIFSANSFENRSYDHVSLGTNTDPVIQLEMTLLAWRNHFYCDIFAENGSAHINSLCKWGPSTFTLRKRKLPSGRPDEESVELVQSDPTWVAEYAYFKQLCQSGVSNIGTDIWINDTLASLSRALQNGEGRPTC
jgi:predicted dehydrogenase